MIVYENHEGKRITLNKRPYKLLNIDNLYDIDRDFTRKNGRITSFNNGTSEKSVELDVLSIKDISWKNAYEEMQNIFNTDTYAQKPGKLYVGEYYLECFIYAILPKSINLTHPYVTCTLRIISNDFIWLKPTRYTYLSSDATPGSHHTKRYPYMYPFRYQARVGVGTMFNPVSFSSHFQMIFYGLVKNPVVVINDHVYGVDTEVSENEYLIIDYSGEHKREIKLHKRDGNIEDKFNDRNRQSGVFTKIEPGKSTVQWSGNFTFDIIVYEERSQPKWI